MVDVMYPRKLGTELAARAALQGKSMQEFLHAGCRSRQSSRAGMLNQNLQ
jgi:hypothetical protein